MKDLERLLLEKLKNLETENGETDVMVILNKNDKNAQKPETMVCLPFHNELNIFLKS